MKCKRFNVTGSSNIVTLCDPICHTSSLSGVANCCKLLYSIYFTLIVVRNNNHCLCPFQVCDTRLLVRCARLLLSYFCCCVHVVSFNVDIYFARCTDRFCVGDVDRCRNCHPRRAFDTRHKLSVVGRWKSQHCTDWRWLWRLSPRTAAVARWRNCQETISSRRIKCWGKLAEMRQPSVNIKCFMNLPHCLFCSITTVITSWLFVQFWHVTHEIALGREHIFAMMHWNWCSVITGERRYANPNPNFDKYNVSFSLVHNTYSGCFRNIVNSTHNFKFTVSWQT